MMKERLRAVREQQRMKIMKLFKEKIKEVGISHIYQSQSPDVS